MRLSKQTLETLIDLLEIKLSCFEVHDREDKREFASLERSVAELKILLDETRQDTTVVVFPGR